jgi:hypothetical protein
VAGFLYKPGDLLAVRTESGRVYEAEIRDMSDGRVMLDTMEVLRPATTTVGGVARMEPHGAVWGVTGTWDGAPFTGFFVESGALYHEDETLPAWLERVIDALV